MEALMLTLIPSLDGQPTLLILISCVFIMFFGSMVYSFIFSLFSGFKD